MKNLYLSLLSISTAATVSAANLPTASNISDPTIPRLHLIADTLGLYLYNPLKSGGGDWVLLTQYVPVTVANLPTAKIAAGSTAVVSDATTPTLGAVLTGGGAVQVAVIYNGTTWRVA